VEDVRQTELSAAFDGMTEQILGVMVASVAVAVAARIIWVQVVAADIAVVVVPDMTQPKTPVAVVVDLTLHQQQLILV
jgi:hypothetical protein